MKLERADLQTLPLVEGRFYLVPIVRAAWYGWHADWPVMGPLHEDREFLNFPYDHYHLDPRFLPPGFRKLYRVFTHPLHADARFTGAGPLPAPELRRRKCVRSFVPFSPPWEAAALWQTLRKAFAGRQCARGKGGWVCPHRKASLGAIAPEGGVITCPLHGLRIDAASGVVLPA
jgi:hypothetical protein